VVLTEPSFAGSLIMLCQIFAYAPVAARLLQASCRLGSFGNVSAFAAAVAPCHRFVPDEMSVQFFGGAFQAQFP